MRWLGMDTIPHSTARVQASVCVCVYVSTMRHKVFNSHNTNLSGVNGNLAHNYCRKKNVSHKHTCTHLWSIRWRAVCTRTNEKSDLIILYILFSEKCQ